MSINARRQVTGFELVSIISAAVIEGENQKNSNLCLTIILKGLLS